jgi:hypothetical protein
VGEEVMFDFNGHLLAREMQCRAPMAVSKPCKWNGAPLPTPTVVEGFYSSVERLEPVD